MTKVSIIVKGKLKKEISAELPRIASQFLEKKKIRGNFLVYLTITSEDKIKELNSRYRKINKPTDVLSFPILRPAQIKKAKGEKLLGDIFISPKNAKHSIEFLFLHGFKHLLGFHHR